MTESGKKNGTILAFLRARLDEMERVARDADDGHSDLSEGPYFWASGEYPHVCVEPALVLREVEAKRRLVDKHYEEQDSGEPLCITCECIGEYCDTLLLLTLPYSDHPNYDPSWRL